MFATADAILRIALRKAATMSIMSYDAASLQAAAVLPSAVLFSAFPPFIADSANPPPSGGYAFETALCLVESQSPLLRPVSDGHEGGASAMIEEHETHVLLGRVRSLAKLLAGVRGHLDSDDWRMLLDAAARVATELTAALDGLAKRLSTDPARKFKEQVRISAALAEARWLADKLRDATLPQRHSTDRVH